MKIPNFIKKEIKSDIKTTLISILMVLVVIVSCIAAFIGKMTFAEAGVFIGAVGTTLASIGFKLTADSTKGGNNNEQ